MLSTGHIRKKNLFYGIFQRKRNCFFPEVGGDKDSLIFSLSIISHDRAGILINRQEFAISKYFFVSRSFAQCDQLPVII